MALPKLSSWSLGASILALINARLPLSGGTLTGDLTLNADPSSALHAATKQYADTKLPKSGGTMTGALTLSGAPTVDLHASTKKYVDDQIAAIPGAATFEGFVATKGGTDQTGIATVTYTKLTATTEVFDVGSKYDAANSKWTPSAGKVVINACYHFSAGTADQGYIRLALYKNGVGFRNIWMQLSGTGSLGIIGQWLDDANGTDYYEIYCYGATTTSLTVSGSTGLTYWSGHKVG